VVNIADIYVNASHGTEATSLSILEAMSLGKPVVATNYGGNPFIVENGKTGTTIPVKDPDALAAALVELLENESRYEEYSKNALKAYRDNYTDTVMNGKIEDAYLQLCKKGPR
jgi:glycosyltransferase involved in cell wall biosynthesis